MSVRLTRDGPAELPEPFADADDVIAERRAEADEFYDAITPPASTADARAVMRQALAGMLWSKQCYYFDLDLWLRERQAHPLRAPTQRGTRNESWFHMVNHDVISMPDKWEYPWYAAWDLAFHCIPLAMVDPDFAKSQVDLMLSQVYLHPSGQMPAYEWNFGDVNPPVHAFATLFLLQRWRRSWATSTWRSSASLHALLLNFTWWVNRKDPTGRNVFEGGFLGLDNIGVFDRSAPLPTGGRLEQADGTAWMAMFSQNMLELALALAGARRLRGPRAQVRRALLLDRGRRRPGRRPPRRDVGRGGRLLLRRPAPARRHRPAPQGALARRAAPALRHHGDRAAASSTRFPELAAAHRRPTSTATTTCWPTSPTRWCRASTAATSCRSSTRTSCAASSPGCSTRSASSGPTASARCPRAHLDEPYDLEVEGVEHRVQYEPAESTTRDVRRQLELARAGVVPRSTC